MTLDAITLIVDRVHVEHNDIAESEANAALGVVIEGDGLGRVERIDFILKEPDGALQSASVFFAIVARVVIVVVGQHATDEGRVEMSGALIKGINAATGSAATSAC